MCLPAQVSGRETRVHAGLSLQYWLHYQESGNFSYTVAVTSDFV